MLNTTAPAKIPSEGIRQILQPENFLPSPSSARNRNICGATSWHTVGKPEIAPAKFYPAPEFTPGSQRWSGQSNNFHSSSLLWETRKLKNSSNPHPVDGQGRERCCWSAVEDACWPQAYPASQKGWSPAHRGFLGKAKNLQRPNPARAVWALLLLLQGSFLLHSLGQGKCPRQEQSHPISSGCTRGGLDWTLGKISSLKGCSEKWWNCRLWNGF